MYMPTTQIGLGRFQFRRGLGAIDPYTIRINPDAWSQVNFNAETPAGMLPPVTSGPGIGPGTLNCPGDPGCPGYQLPPGGNDQPIDDSGGSSAPSSFSLSEWLSDNSTTVAIVGGAAAFLMLFGGRRR